MQQLQAKISKNEKIGSGFFRMRIASSYLAEKSGPGQFVEVRCSAQTDPLLRRPLGLHRVVNGGIELLYEVVGKGTELLSHMKSGALLDVIGPLGTGFDIPDRRGASILVAGGNGVAPLLALAEKLACSVERIAYSEKQKIHVFIGAKTKGHILCAEDFKKIGCDVNISTENGSKGHKGFITDLLSDFLNAKCYMLYANLYACGPTGMLKAVAEIARDRRIPCQVSLEERMACGLGVCLGCPVKVKTAPGYKMVCKDGPVFDAEDIAW